MYENIQILQDRKAQEFCCGLEEQKDKLRPASKLTYCSADNSVYVAVLLLKPTGNPKTHFSIWVHYNSQKENFRGSKLFLVCSHITESYFVVVFFCCCFALRKLKLILLRITQHGKHRKKKKKGK